MSIDFSVLFNFLSDFSLKMFSDFYTHKKMDIISCFFQFRGLNI